VREFLAWLETLIARRRRRPGDPARDVLTRLIQGEAETGERLSEHELLHNCIFILNAGHETTTLIGNALHLLCEWPGERGRLLAEPTLMRSAVEEFLRFQSSNQLGNRRAVRPARVGGVDLPAGALVTLCIGAANRDPAVFAEPDRLDVARKPNPHLGFGGGAHICAGLLVARLEARVALSMLLARFPRYALDGAPVRGGRARFRGFLSLPARLEG
jgi:cytochrome P450